MRTKILGLAITVWWLIMMGSLVYRYVPGRIGRLDAPPLDMATLADAWHDSDEWMDLRWNAVRIGVMRTVARRLPSSEDMRALDTAAAPPKANPKESYQVAVMIGLDVGFFQGRTSTSALLNDRLILDQFSLRVDLGEPGTPGHSGLRVDGIARATTLLVRFERGDTQQFRSVKLARPVALAESLAPLYSRTDLKVGDTYTLPVFDPVWNMQGGVMTVHVAGRESLLAGARTIDALRVETTMGNVKAKTWVDESGRIWKREIPPLEMAAIEPDAALRRFPWMAELPPPPHLTMKDMQGKAYGAPFGPNGVFGLLRDAMTPPATGQRAGSSTSPGPTQ